MLNTKQAKQNSSVGCTASLQPLFCGMNILEEEKRDGQRVTVEMQAQI